MSKNNLWVPMWHQITDLHIERNPVHVQFEVRQWPYTALNSPAISWYLAIRRSRHRTSVDKSDAEAAAGVGETQ